MTNHLAIAYKVVITLCVLLEVAGQGPTFTCPRKVAHFLKLVNVHYIFPVDCQASTGSTVEHVVWIFNGQVLTSNQDYSMAQFSNGTVRLNLIHPEQRDRGLYQCNVTLNVTGQLYQMTGQTDVTSIPFFSYILDPSYYVNAEDGIAIECRESGSFQTILSWQKNDRDLVADNERVFFGTNQDHQANGVLIFKSTVYEDRATYTCNGHNADGFAQVATYLRVQNPLRWLWPLLGIIGTCLAVAIIVVVSEFSRKRRPHRLSVDHSSDSLPRFTITAEGEVVIPIFNMMAHAEAMGHPPSVIDAALKWRAKTEAGKLRRMTMNKKPQHGRMHFNIFSNKK